MTLLPFHIYMKLSGVVKNIKKYKYSLYCHAYKVLSHDKVMRDELYFYNQSEARILSKIIIAVNSLLEIKSISFFFNFI